MKRYKIKDYDGAIAQLGARLTGSQKVTGSTPVSSILKTGGFMKKFAIALMLISVLFTFSCTKNKGTSMDFAAIKDAQRTMTKLGNLMEQYYVENESYPLTQEQFEKDIRPYFITYNTENQEVDKWNEMVEKVFSGGKIIYTSNDPKKTYFAYGKAKDSNETVVFCRPAMQHDSTNMIATEE